jgi:hypothetical protein
MQNLFSTDDQLVLIGAVCTAVLVLTSTLILFYRRKSSSKTCKDSGADTDWSSLYNEETVFDEPKKEIKSPQAEPNPSELKNVFDVKQSATRIDKAKPSSSAQADDSTADSTKPFKSSYYYAHNNPNTIGGYKDGLKAEDYVMNGPRLLGKSKTSKESSNTNTTTTKTPARNATPVTPKAKHDSTPINRYLWDDDGNTDGIAKIIVNTLPSSGTPTSSTMTWQDAGISSKEDVRSKLLGVSQNGLIVQIRRKINESNNRNYKRYHLYVPKMSGEVEEVKLIVKAKKLIVKLYKKQGRDNLQAWPQLPSKVVNPTLSKDTNYIEEDLFSS